MQEKNNKLFLTLTFSLLLLTGDFPVLFQSTREVEFKCDDFCRDIPYYSLSSWSNSRELCKCHRRSPRTFACEELASSGAGLARVWCRRRRSYFGTTPPPPPPAPVAYATSSEEDAARDMMSTVHRLLTENIGEEGQTDHSVVAVRLGGELDEEEEEEDVPPRGAAAKTGKEREDEPKEEGVSHHPVRKTSMGLVALVLCLMALLLIAVLGVKSMLDDKKARKKKDISERIAAAARATTGEGPAPPHPTQEEEERRNKKEKKKSSLKAVPEKARERLKSIHINMFERH